MTAKISQTREFIVSYNTSLYNELSGRSDVDIKNIDNQWMILYYNSDNTPTPSEVLYLQTPKAFAPTISPSTRTAGDTAPLDVSGLTTAQLSAGLALKGQGTLVGIIDSGIDYTNPIFAYARGLSKIEMLMDQTTGATYDNRMINEALLAQIAGKNPQTIVPASDETGQGTFLAGIAAGSADKKNSFCGAAPDAGLLVVKLKPISRYLKSFYLIDEDAIAYSEADIMLGLQFLLQQSQRLGKPLSICLALQSSMGPHIAGTPLSSYISRIASYVNTSIVIPTGNEGNSRHHYTGFTSNKSPTDNVEIYVAEENSGFILELWASGEDLFSVGFTTPYGEVIEKIPAKNKKGGTTVKPALENTLIQVDYDTSDNVSGGEVIRMRLQNPTPGIWKLAVHGLSGLSGRFNLWLPVNEFLSSEVYFLKPSPDTTLTLPSATKTAISVGAHDQRTGGLYLESGRGPTADGLIKPDITAPGVNVTGPAVSSSSVANAAGSGAYTTASGTGIAAAYVAGAVSLLYSANTYKENPEYPSQTAIKSRLVRSATRNQMLTYPNNEFGYGTLNAYGAAVQVT